MSEKDSKPSGKDDGGAAEVQKKMDEEQEKGYRGEVPDPTPNENYTASHNDAPTPETDPKLAEEARRNRQQR